MRSLFKRVRKFALNTALVIVAIWALATILIPNTDLSSKGIWVGAATLLVFTYFFSKRKLSKRGYQDKQGYILIAGTTIYQHRAIAKRILNRNLLSNEVVHHINGTRSDNRLINLCVMDRHQHELFHAWLDWKKRKRGRYPSIEEQKRLLQEKHQGILLEDRSSFRPNTNSSPLPTVKRGDSKNILHERQQDYSRKLFSELRRERMRLASEKNIPAYLIFKDFTLAEMAKQMPEDTEALENIIGVNPEKLRLYGDRFLEVIYRYKSDRNKRNSVS